VRERKIAFVVARLPLDERCFASLLARAGVRKRYYAVTHDDASFLCAPRALRAVISPPLFLSA